MIGAIGEWVLKEACRQIKAWQAAGETTLLVAVNISIGQLRTANFPASVEGILRAANLTPHLLELEITESTAMQDAANTVIALKILSDMGLLLAIDDFGTGYSSLSHLKNFPATYLKIDRSFVQGIPADKNDVAIVRTIIGMAKNLGMRLIAEGVETAEQLEFLKKEGCDEAQGFLFCKPLPADELADFVRKYNAR
jgi:EAL domain-containing protein (putative c-di-GMP-specific phosphodiesterase class I)